MCGSSSSSLPTHARSSALTATPASSFQRRRCRSNRRERCPRPGPRSSASPASPAPSGTSPAAQSDHRSTCAGAPARHRAAESCGQPPGSPVLQVGRDSAQLRLRSTTPPPVFVSSPDPSSSAHKTGVDGDRARPTSLATLSSIEPLPQCGMRDATQWLPQEAVKSARTRRIRNGRIGVRGGPREVNVATPGRKPQ